MSDDAQKIKDHIDLTDYIGKSVNLKNTGKNLRGICPFHQEKTPSFFVSPDRQTWRCFGCDRGGDLITFVMEKDGLDFQSTLELLARESGIQLQQNHPPTSNSRKLFELLEQAVAFYKEQLKKTPAALNYITNQRKISPALLEEFEVGYSPDSWDTTGKFLIGNGATNDELVKSGLSIEKNGSTYDRFRHRIMFPIRDRLNRVVGFSGRTLDQNPDTAKYINTPETEIYKKHTSLYGLKQARDTIRTSDYTIVVEGTVDVIAMHRIGIRNVVAPLGSALTAEQIIQLKRLSNRLLLFFDNDSAGLKATLRAIQIGLTQGLEIKATRPTAGKDPDEASILNQNQTRQDLAKAQAFLDFLFRELNVQSSSSTGSSQISRHILPFIKSIPDQVLREGLINQISQTTGISSNALATELEKVSTQYQPDFAEQPIAKPKPIISRYTALWQEATAMLLQIPTALEQDAQLMDFVSELNTEDLMNNDFPLGNKVAAHVIAHNKVIHSLLTSELSDEENELADFLTLKDLGNVTSDEEKFLNTLKHLLRDLKKIQVKQRLKVLTDQRFSGENDARQREIQVLTKKLHDLQ